MSTPGRKLRFVDIGINLTDKQYHGRYHGKNHHPSDFSSVMQRATEHGVEGMLITGDNLHGSVEAVALAKQWGHFATVGCHPTRCDEFDKKASSPEAYLGSLRKVIAENIDVVAAIGECGLDYDREMFCKAPVQRKYFPLHFQLAEEFNLPLFLHSRNTGEDFTNVMRANMHRLKAGGVVHSFTGSVGEAKALLDLGLYIGINGCSMKTDENLRAVASIPLDKIVLETDGPWCDIRPTHSSHALLWPTSPAAAATAPAAGKGGKKKGGAPPAAVPAPAPASAQEMTSEPAPPKGYKEPAPEPQVEAAPKSAPPGAQVASKKKRGGRGGHAQAQSATPASTTTTDAKSTNAETSAATSVASAMPSEEKLRAELLGYAAELLLPLPPTVKHDKFAPGSMVKGRNEPCMMRQVFQVLYTLRRHEVKGPVELCDIIFENTMKAFPKMRRPAPAPATK